MKGKAVHVCNSSVASALFHCCNLCYVNVVVYTVGKLVNRGVENSEIVPNSNIRDRNSELRM